MIVVDLTVRLRVDAETMTPALREALEDLAAVMMVQAEDGVWTGGDPDADDAEQVADLVDGPDAMATTVTEVAT